MSKYLTAIDRLKMKGVGEVIKEADKEAIDLVLSYLEYTVYENEEVILESIELKEEIRRLKEGVKVKETKKVFKPKNKKTGG